MRTVAVTGKNFGDEGKGLVTASLCFSCSKPLIIKHNGGAQAGHTVESSSLHSRFIHHQTGSGSEYGAPTLFAGSYLPDLFQLGNELKEFEKCFHFRPALYSEPDTKITTIDDVLLNMAIETERGINRHGSCGMGIYECCLRNRFSEADASGAFSLTIQEVAEKKEYDILTKLRSIRSQYTEARINKLSLSKYNPYVFMLRDDIVLVNFAHAISKNCRYIKIVDADAAFLNSFDNVIFEAGQGLLLDEDNQFYAPHISASKTGIAEPVCFLDKRKLKLDEAIYVSRTYVTRHGAGFLPCECSISELPGVKTDNTNVANEWQGCIRYARHESLDSFIRPMTDDINKCLPEKDRIRPSLAITHLDETDGKIYFSDKILTLEELSVLLTGLTQNIYVSYDHESIVSLNKD